MSGTQLVSPAFRKLSIKDFAGASQISHERLPMLDVVFDRFLRELSSNLREIASDNVDVVLERIVSQRLSEAYQGTPDHSIYIIFMAEEWENYGVIVLDPRFVYFLIEVLMGGDCTIDIEEENALTRPYTAIDRVLVEPVAQMMLADLAQSFSPLCAVTFQFERMEVSQRFAAICRPVNGVVSARFSVAYGKREGAIEVILPHATLEPVRDILIQQFMGEKFGHDLTWEQHLARELWNMEAELEVVFEEKTIRLRDILDMEPGTQIFLQRAGSGQANLRCGGVALYEGRVGQKDGRIALKIEGRYKSGLIPENSDDGDPEHG